MNKTELIDVIAKASDTSKAEAGRILETILDTIAGSLAKGEEVALVGFGTFAVSSRKERTGRNPKTGESITIHAAKVPKFKAGKNLKDTVNK
jgi:DNA-binding protein HU-beta